MGQATGDTLCSSGQSASQRTRHVGPPRRVKAASPLSPEAYHYHVGQTDSLGAIATFSRSLVEALTLWA